MNPNVFGMLIIFLKTFNANDALQQLDFNRN